MGLRQQISLYGFTCVCFTGRGWSLFDRAASVIDSEAAWRIEMSIVRIKGGGSLVDRAASVRMISEFKNLVCVCARARV